MIDIEAVTNVLTTKSVCLMHLIIDLKMKEFEFLLTHCIKLTKNHTNKFSNSTKNVFSQQLIRLFVLKQSIFSDNKNIYLF